ncbi:MAG: hypothetical protein AB8I08_11070 [Sandaracinaceae bacterium]
MSEDVVQDLALGGFRLVKESLDFELDFTPETLPVADHYLREFRGDGKIDEKALQLVGPCLGAYFGEVVRRSLPGFRWHLPEDDYPRWRLEGVPFFLAFNPIGVVLEAIYGDPIAGWGAHFALLNEQQEIIEQALEVSGPVRAEDYHRLAVRHEVLVQTVTRLEELERGASRQFSAEAYASLLDGTPGSTDA